MSPATESPREGVALALSGGGFRATLFHAGALVRLDELGVLARVTRIASVSGGSITAAVLAREIANNGGVVGKPAIDRMLVRLRRLCERTVDIWATLRGLVDPSRHCGEALADAYAAHLFGQATLQDLPEAPVFVLCATNLQTGRAFRMSRRYLADHLLGMVDNPRIRLATAVAASSAFPPFLAPVVLRFPPEAFRRTEGAHLYDQASLRSRVVLADGGVYDNLGLEPTKGFATILVSDAGAPFDFRPRPRTPWLCQLRRTLDVAIDQSRALRKRHLIEELKGGRTGTYWGIATDITKYPLGDRLPCRPAVVEPLARLRTRLSPFGDEEQGRLINWGYALADAAARAHVPALLAPTVPAPSWPCPEQALG